MTSNGQHFVFFVEATSQEAQETPAPVPGSRETPRRKLTSIEVPSGAPSYLSVAAGKPPQVVADARKAGPNASVLEPIRHEYHPYLVMLPAGGIRLNGLPAPPVAILRPGDQIRTGDAWLLHVSLLTGPQIGPPSEEQVGEECPYCRLKIAAGRTVAACPHCGMVYHCEGEERPEQDRLECARLIAECYHCHKPMVLEERYEYIPES